MTGRAFVLAWAMGLAACGSGGGFPDAPEIDAPPPGGTFTLAWSLTDTGGSPITCDQVGAQSVTALMRNRSVQGGFTEVFTCGTLMGTSQALTPGIYDVDFQLIGTGGPPPDGLIATATRQMGVTIGSGQTVALQPLTFTVDATGGLQLKLDAGATAGNCETTAQGGAGITSMTITLNHTGDGTCAPVTFAVAAGATRPASSYTVNCTTPTVAACIDSDQQLSVTGVASGSYQIHVRGSRGATECYSNDDTLPVPPLGRDLVRTLNLARATACP